MVRGLRLHYRDDYLPPLPLQLPQRGEVWSEVRAFPRRHSLDTLLLFINHVNFGPLAFWASVAVYSGLPRLGNVA